MIHEATMANIQARFVPSGTGRYELREPRNPAASAVTQPTPSVYDPDGNLWTNVEVC